MTLVKQGHCKVYINVTMRRSRVGWTQRREVPESVVLRAKIFIGPCAPKVVRKKVVRKGGQKTTGRVSRLEGTVPARLLGRVGGVDSTPWWWDHGLAVDSPWRPRVGVAYLSCDAGGDIALGDCPCVVHRCARHTCGIRTLMFKNLTRPATIEYVELARRVRHLAPVCAASLWAYGRL